MNEENKKEQGLAIPIYTKPIASDGSNANEIDDSLQTVEEQLEQGTLVQKSFEEPTQPTVQNNNEQPVQEESVQQVEQTAQEEYVQQDQPVQQIPVAQSEFERYANNLNGGLDEQARQNLIAEDEDSDKHLKAFIGPNYDKFVQGKFNWGYFFFGFFYLCYRKMYAKAIFFLIVVNAIGNIAEHITKVNGLASIVFFVFSLFYSFNASSAYYKFANNKVRNIEYKYMDKTDDEITEICRKKGGRSFVGVLIGFGIILLLSIIAAIIMFVLTIFGLFQIGLFSLAPSIGGSDSGTFSGTFSHDETFVIEDFDYNLPSKFKVEMNDYAAAVFIKDNDKNDRDCKLEIVRLKNYKDAGKLNKEYGNYCHGGNIGEIETSEGVTINTDNCKDLEPINGTSIKWYGYEELFSDRIYFGQVGDTVLKADLQVPFDETQIPSCVNDATMILESLRKNNQ